MDSANILSILASLGGNAAPAVPANVLQAAAMPPSAPQPAPMPVQAPPPPPPPAPVVAEPPKRRRSLLDTIGRISDVLAQVGGATPLYQATVDAATKRATEAQDHTLLVDKSTIGNATDEFKLGDLQNERLGQIARGLKAIKAGGGDIQRAAPILMQRMGFDPATIQSVGQTLAADPNALDGFIAATTDPKLDQSRYGGTYFPIRNKATGEIQVLQPSLTNDEPRNLLPPGYEYVEPTQFIDQGGQKTGYGKNTGTPKIIIPNTEKPGFSGGVPIKERPGFSGGRPIAPAPTKDDGKGSDPNAGLRIISDIQQSFDNLHNLKALPGDTTNPIGAVEGVLSRTRLGQAIGATTGLSAAAQERELLSKNLANLQSDLIKSLPGNATRTRFEQEIQKKRLPDATTMSYATANRAIGQIREAYMAALKSQPGSTNIPRLSPADAAKLAPGTAFIGLDGVRRVRQ